MPTKKRSNNWKWTCGGILLNRSGLHCNDNYISPDGSREIILYSTYEAHRKMPREVSHPRRLLRRNEVALSPVMPSKKKAWGGHPWCTHCKDRRTKNGVCARCVIELRKKKNAAKRKAKKDRGNLTQAMRDDFVKRAKTQYHDEGTCEIDDNAEVSYVSPSRGGSGGAYVQAWVWVYGKDHDKEIPYG